ncbi:MAG: SDR family oxidoreductase [Bdellovibrionaceae bacterium]|nr:SDR family oxidoreductase [Pseudobdellovibrionaceae bacterium]
MTVLVTGAGRGIGLEFVRQLLTAKKTVVAWVRQPEKATELAKLKTQYPTLTIQQVDVTQEQSVQTAIQQLNSVDIVINNAGILNDAGESLSTLSIEKIKETFDVNVYAPIRVAQNILPLLQKSSAPLLVNISSKMGSIDDNTRGRYYAYRMSKTALNMFTKSFSVDFPKIKTFCMHPGWVQTDMGGAGASTSTEQSVTGLLRTILEPQKYKTGSFINFEGQEIPW